MKVYAKYATPEPKKSERPAVLMSLTVLLLGLLLLVGCGGSGGGDAPVTEGDFLLPSAPGETVLGNDYASMDASNLDAGYICIKYLGSNEKVKLQIKNGSETYTYDLKKSDDYLVFPFTCGSGTYSVEVYENVSGNQYAQVCGETVTVSLADENEPFLYPNYYVNYGSDDSVVSLSLTETASCETQLEVVETVFDYVIDNIDYDYDLADSVGSGYIPDLDTIISTEKGICFDYASLMSAMLRIRNIPTKLVVGYSGDLYHAWISVYITDVGWVDNVIEFDGENWTLMDPTYAAAGGSAEAADYVGNQENYHALYFY
ncbi:MAG: transglutaminase-like domain-containing protein [Bacillota bacterium]|nr:transglutaminase-like domain-containing protein [Bacillota bacterium]